MKMTQQELDIPLTKQEEADVLLNLSSSFYLPNDIAEKFIRLVNQRDNLLDEIKRLKEERFTEEERIKSLLQEVVYSRSFEESAIHSFEEKLK